MFNDGLPDQLPSDYGSMDGVTVRQTPRMRIVPNNAAEARAMENYVRASGGQILPPKPPGYMPGVYRSPIAAEMITKTSQHPGTPYAPQPPYVGKELAELVSDTPFSAGDGVPLHIMGGGQPQMLGGDQATHHMGRAYGADGNANDPAAGNGGGDDPSWWKSDERWWASEGDDKWWHDAVTLAPTAPIDSTSPEQIKALANALYTAGFNVPATYSLYDQTMISGVTALQQAAGLTQNGLYGTPEQAALDQILKSSRREQGWNIAGEILDMFGDDTPTAAPAQEDKGPNWVAIGAIVGVVGLLTVVTVSVLRD